jgi:hypothetical protein
MAENLDVLNTAVFLLIRALLLDAPVQADTIMNANLVPFLPILAGNRTRTT